MDEAANDQTKLAAADGAGENTTAPRGLRKAEDAVVAQPGRRVRLAEIDPAGKAGWSKRGSNRRVAKLRERLAELQQALYAEHQRSLLIVVQAMDTGGKDGAIKNLCSGLDPSGVQLTNFKVPSAEELEHDFLWRIHKAVPRKGEIGIWNRSHYEDVLVPLVHKQITRKICRERYDDINAFEKLLKHNGVTLLKFFLYISKDEQKERLEARLKDPHKLWKFNPGDLKERVLWDAYQRAYEDAINNCTTEYASWQIIPANRKWVRNLVILNAVIKALEEMKPKYPAPSFDPKSVVIP